ncbi:hypothetical protein BH09GEM1_BH09GEM1_16050 [soil metagenome]
MRIERAGELAWSEGFGHLSSSVHPEAAALAEAVVQLFVIPAKAGIHFRAWFNGDSRFRGNDERSAKPGFRVDIHYPEAYHACRAAEKSYSGRRTPRSVMMAEISAAGVMSNAGL